MIYLYLIVFGLLFISIKWQKTVHLQVVGNSGQGSEVFSRNNTTALKGFFALGVVLHHIGQRCGLTGYFERFNSLMGWITVGGFFFLSAYGLIKSYMKNPDGYAKRMLLVKIPSLYLFQIFINIIYYLAIPENSLQSAGNVVLQIFSLDIFANLPRINGYSWFITTILFIYIFFTIAILVLKLFKKHVKKDKLFIGIFTSILILGYYLVFKYVPSLSGLYIHSIFCFILGIFYSFYSVKINSVLSNKTVFYPALLSLISLTLILFFFACDEQIISLLVCLLLIVISQKVTFENNKPLKILGEISLEIYLLQLLGFNLLAFDFSSLQFIKGIAIFGTSIIIAFLYHTAYYGIINLIKLIILKLKPKKKQDKLES